MASMDDNGVKNDELLELGLEFEPLVDPSCENDVGFPYEILDFLPDIYFWKKNASREYEYASKAFLDRYGFKSIENIKGLTDEDIYSPFYASESIKEDERVLQMRLTMKNKPELVPNSEGCTEWREVTKMPLLDTRGESIGLVGISRVMHLKEGVSGASQLREVMPIMSYIYDNITKELSLIKVSKQAGISISTLERLFKKYLGTTPKQWIARAKLSVVCEYLLENDVEISSVVTRMGYEDHANFTRAFGAILGMSPREYRKKYANKNSKK